MRRIIPFLLGALAIAGCSYEQPGKSGLELLAASHRAEENQCYTSEETNEQIVAGAWPLAGQAGAVAPVAMNGQAGASAPMAMYGRPVRTLVKRVQCGPYMKRFEVLDSDIPGVEHRIIRVRNGSRGWRYDPVAKRLNLLTFPSSDMGSLNWMALILDNYAVEGVRPDSVIGIPAWYLEVHPKHPGGPMKRLWLDRETYLPLRQELWGADGRLISTTQVTKRPEERLPNLEEFGPPAITDAGVRVVQGDEDWHMDEGQLVTELGFPLAHIQEMPAGFQKVGSYLYVCPDAFGRCARWEFTDGIATVNVIQTMTDTHSDSDHSQAAPEDVQGGIEMTRLGPYHFIVRGNVSPSELRRIANSITLAPARG